MVVCFRTSSAFLPKYRVNLVSSDNSFPPVATVPSFLLLYLCTTIINAFTRYTPNSSPLITDCCNISLDCLVMLTARASLPFPTHFRGYSLSYTLSRLQPFPTTHLYYTVPHNTLFVHIFQNRLGHLDASDDAMKTSSFPRSLIGAVAVFTLDASCWRYGISSRCASTYSRTARNGKASRRPSGQPSWRRPRSFGAQPGGETAPRLRSCLPTSGAARRSWAFSRQQAQEGWQAHRWQKREKKGPARPRSGKTENARSNSHY